MEDLDEDPTTTFDNLQMDNFEGNDTIDDLDGAGEDEGGDDGGVVEEEGEDTGAAASTAAATTTADGGGKSRAAKRRAKIKDRIQNLKKSEPDDDVIDLADDNDDDAKEAAAPTKKKARTSNATAAAVPGVGGPPMAPPYMFMPYGVLPEPPRPYFTPTNNIPPSRKEEIVTLLTSIIEKKKLKRALKRKQQEEGDGTTAEELTESEPNKNGGDTEIADEALPMKEPAPVVEESEIDPKPVLPADCKNILEILLVDVDSNNDDAEDGDDTIMEIDAEGNEVIAAKSKENAAAVFRQMSAQDRGQSVIEFFLQPSSISLATFYETYWEQQPLCIRGGTASQILATTTDLYDMDDVRGKTRYDGIISEESIYHDIFEAHKLYYTRDISVTKLDKNKETGNIEVVSLDRPKLDIPADAKYSAGEDLDNYFVPIVTNDVWNDYKHNGSTIRLLCPVKYSPILHSLVSLLELEFGCRVGVDVTLKPASTKPRKQDGHRKILNDQYHLIPPKYDGMECFHIQIEGYQRYKIFEPIPGKSLKLPRLGGGQDAYNISEDFLTGKNHKTFKVEPIMDVTLRPGDVIYIPRGFVYQSYPLFINENDTVPDVTTEDDEHIPHSLHITVSAMQQWSWIDLFEILVPEALQSAAVSATSTALREGLPRRFLDYMGTIHDNYRNVPKVLQAAAKNEDSVDGGGDENVTTIPAAAAKAEETEDEAKTKATILKLQTAFRTEAKKRLLRVVKEANKLIDAACDQLAVRFISDRAPPALSLRELASTCNNGSTERTIIQPTTFCRLVRPGIARLAIEENEEANTKKAVLYHCNDNSLLFHEHPVHPLEFETDDAPAIEQILTTVEPRWICVADLFHDTIEDKIGVVRALFDEGILSIREA